MIVIETKKNCKYCQLIKSIFITNNIEFTEVAAKNVAPIVKLDDKIVYIGLPEYDELLKFCEKYGN